MATTVPLPFSSPALELATTWAEFPSNSSHEPFANHDCVGIALPVLDWDALRNNLRTSCGHTRETRTLRCAATIDGWQSLIIGFLRSLVEPGVRGDEDLIRREFEVLDHLLPAAYAQCRLGVLVLYVARTLLCLLMRDIDCYLKHSGWLSMEMFNTPLTVVMGTDWPIFALLNSYDWSYPGIPPGNDYDCTSANTSTLDWPRMLSALQDDATRPMASWWLDLLRYTFDNKLATSMYLSSYECLYGVYVLNMIKAMWTADTESSAFRIYAPYVGWIHYESLHLLGASRWRIFELMHHFTSLRRHGFRLDFTAKELGGLPWRDQGAWLQSLPSSQHVSLLRTYEESMKGATAALSRALSAFRAALERTTDSRRGSADAAGNDRLAYVTMVYGRMNRFIRGWAVRAEVLGIKNLVMATLDDEALELCETHYVADLCVPASVSVLNKYTLLLVALQLGLDVMWLDFDVFIVRHPTSALTKAASGYDLLMGYDLDSDCLCNGFFFIRSRPRTHRWLFELVRWLYDHPYEHDQRAMGAFLNYTEKISADPEELPPIPRWHVFDEENQFINYGSWLGDFDQLTLVHFVDGSAFSLYGRPSWDASIPVAKTPAAVETEPKKSASAGSPMDHFYRPEVTVLPPAELFRRAPQVAHMLQQQVVPKPRQKQKCGILPMVVSAHPGFGWLAALGSRSPPPEWHEPFSEKKALPT